MFRKARQNRIFQDIVDQIQTAIVQGELRPGERLPPEREMCALFNTSRGTLREALRILEQKRLISIKLGAGGGAVVREISGELMEENLGLLIGSGRISTDHLSAMNADLAALIASRAANRAGADDVEPLKQLVIRLSQLLEEEQSPRSLCQRMDELLFTELAHIAKTPLHALFLRSGRNVLAQIPLQPRHSSDTAPEDHFRSIRKIVYAVATGEPSQAARLAKRHLISGKC